MRILLVSYNTLGQAMSGGDRINIELVRRLRRHHHDVTVVVWKEGALMYEREGIPRELFKVWPSGGRWLGKWPAYVGRMLLAPFLAMAVRFERVDLVWSASDALADVVPAALLARRLRCPWLGAFYLFAPAPWFGYRGAERQILQWPNLLQTVYYLLQQVSLPIIHRRATSLLVTGEEDRERFVRLGRGSDEVFVVRGGLDIDEPRQVSDPPSKQYDAVFVGRFHPQKGVMELLDIWKRVCERRPGSRLALIGVGDLEVSLRKKADELGLLPFVSFLGFVDGPSKYVVLKSARVIVHPAIYDSGGMASAAGLACGLPGVCFDLPSLRSYYEGGFLRASLGDLDAFASHILALLEDSTLYTKMSREALEEAKRWDWDARFDAWWTFVRATSLRA